MAVPDDEIKQGRAEFDGVALIVLEADRLDVAKAHQRPSEAYGGVLTGEEDEGGTGDVSFAGFYSVMAGLVYPPTIGRHNTPYLIAPLVDPPQSRNLPCGWIPNVPDYAVHVRVQKHPDDGAVAAFGHQIRYSVVRTIVRLT